MELGRQRWIEKRARQTEADREERRWSSAALALTSQLAERSRSRSSSICCGQSSRTGSAGRILQPRQRRTRRTESSTRWFGCNACPRDTTPYTTLHFTKLRSLHYATLCDATLHLLLHCTPLHYCTTLHYSALHYTTLHYTTVLHYTTLHYYNFTTTSLHYTHYAMLHHTTPHCTTHTLDCTHYTTLHYTT